MDNSLPDTKPIQSQTAALLDVVNSAVIATPENYEAVAVTILKPVKALQQQVRDTFAEPKRLAHEAHRSICAAETKHLKPLEEIERVAKEKLVAYDDEQERKRREEEARMQAVARRQEEERILSEAVAMEAAGMDREAADVLDAPIDMPVVRVEKATPKVEAVSVREVWSAEVVSIKDLVAHVAANPGLLELVQANEKALNQMARATKGALKIPGVRMVSRRVMAAGA